MTVVDGAPTANYLNNMWNLQESDAAIQDPQLLNIKSCYLPTLVTKSYRHRNHLSQDGMIDTSPFLPNANHSHEKMSAANASKASYTNEFRSRLRLGIHKGHSPSFAMDPEHHMQLVREKQALHEQRTRPKSPISLEPVNVVPLSRPKTKKPKPKNKRLTRSAPELMQARSTKQESSSPIPTMTWTSENHLQLPLLTNEGSIGLAEMIKANVTVSNHSGNSATVEYVVSQHNSNYTSTSPEPRLQIISSTRMNEMKSKQNKITFKPFSMTLKSSQPNYAVLREQRLLSEKLRSYDNETLKVDAQPYKQRDMESILEMVEQAQSQVRCPKQNGRRSCGICPPTAGIIRKGRADSAHLPELLGISNKTESVDKIKKELIVQLPNITYSRANTPAAGSLLGDRSALASAVQERSLGSASAQHEPDE